MAVIHQLFNKDKPKKKQNNSQDHLINHHKIFQKKKGKRNSQRFWIQPRQTSSWWDKFCAGQKVSEE